MDFCSCKNKKYEDCTKEGKENPPCVTWQMKQTSVEEVRPMKTCKRSKRYTTKHEKPEKSTCAYFLNKFSDFFRVKKKKVQNIYHLPKIQLLHKYVHFIFLLTTCTNLILTTVTSPQADICSFILALSCETKASLIIKVICLCIFILPRCSGSTVIGNSLGKQYLLMILDFSWPRLSDDLPVNSIVSFSHALLLYLPCSLVIELFNLPEKSPVAFPVLGGKTVLSIQVSLY